MSPICDPHLNRMNKRASARWAKPSRILSALALRPGEVVADLGAGGGYYTFAFARAVGPKGFVIAVDTVADRLAFIQQQAHEQQLHNIAIYLTTKEKLVLPKIKFDLIFTRNMFHYLDDPDRYFKQIAQYLKSKARVAVIDYKTPTNFLSRFLAPRHHHPDPVIITNSLSNAGLKLDQSFDFLPKQSFQIFTHKDNKG